MALSSGSKILVDDINTALSNKQDKLSYTPVKSVNEIGADANGNVTITYVDSCNYANSAGSVSGSVGATFLSGIAMCTKSVGTSYATLLGFTNATYGQTSSSSGSKPYYLKTIKLPTGGSWVVHGDDFGFENSYEFVGSYSGGTTLDIKTITGGNPTTNFIIAWRYA